MPSRLSALLLWIPPGALLFDYSSVRRHCTEAALAWHTPRKGVSAVDKPVSILYGIHLHIGIVYATPVSGYHVYHWMQSIGRTRRRMQSTALT